VALRLKSAALSTSRLLQREVQGRVEAALASKQVTVAAIFDFDYQPVPSSDPPQFTTHFNEFADTVIQPMLDRVTKMNASIINAVISDIHGYLPTHISARSLPQRLGDPAWNALHCRNRCNYLDDATARAVASSADFMLTTYRQNLGANGFRTVKNVFVPLYFAGRRWGNFEVAYTIGN